MNEIWDKNLMVSNLIAGDPSDFKTVKRKHSVCHKGQQPNSRFFYIRNGQFTITYHNGSLSETIVAKKGDILYLPNDIGYEAYWENEDEYDFVTIIFTLTDENNEIITLSDKIELMVHDQYDLHLINFEELRMIFRASSSGYKLKALSLFWKIMNDILTEWTKTNYSKNNGSVYPAVNYIENNFYNEINVDKLARLCGLCPSAFRKKFRKAVGMSPIEYKNYLKTKKAIELLVTGEFSISEITAAVGFSDELYFYKVFKKFWGNSPKRFVQNLKK